MDRYGMGAGRESWERMNTSRARMPLLVAMMLMKSNSGRSQLLTFSGAPPAPSLSASLSMFAQQTLADHSVSGSLVGGPVGSNIAQDLYAPAHSHLGFKSSFQENNQLNCDGHGASQDYCAKPGLFYPRNDIGFFIDENKALMKRMFGSVSAKSLLRKDEEDQAAVDNTDLRKKRMAKAPQQLTVYLCPVEEELVTPFWAVNGTGIKLAIVNTPPFEQAIHTVKCSAHMARASGTASAGGQQLLVTSQKCHTTRPCWCQQEYSWFRLLAYDPNDNCKGIFMDWFKFPSHCACKCVQAATVNSVAAAVAAASHQSSSPTALPP